MIPDVIVARRSALKIKDEELAKGIRMDQNESRVFKSDWIKSDQTGSKWIKMD